jgi:hypothetical protein
MRVLMPAVLGAAALQAPRLAAQVTPSTWFFELDGDYDSVIADLGGDGIAEITDGVQPARYSSWARQTSVSSRDWAHVEHVLVRPHRRSPRDTRTVFPYMGQRMYEVRCDAHQPETDDPRRNEQMILNHWTAGPDSRRYFTFAFMMAVAPPIGARTYITQWHQDGNHQPPIRLSWNNDNGAHALAFGVWSDGIDADNRMVEAFHALGSPIPAAPGVWYRFMVQVTPGRNGQVAVWQMDNQTGLWVQFASHEGPVGFRYRKWEDKVNRPYAPGRGTPAAEYLTGTDLEYQWKIGQYVNDTDPLRIYYDNIAYGKRWTQATKGRLNGYHKTVLSLPFEEGGGSVVNDLSFRANGGEQGDPVHDYDNDGVIAGTPRWNAQGVAGRCLRLDGATHVHVPMDVTDFDFGNYVSVSLWFRTTNHPADNKGLLFIDEFASTWKLKLYMSDAGLLFGVKHPDETYTLANHAFAPGTYADGQWHHVVGTFNRFAGGGRLKLYVDGQLRAALPGHDKPMLRGNNRLVVGKFSEQGLFVGDLDEVLLRNYAMSQQEVAELYAARGN